MTPSERIASSTLLVAASRLIMAIVIPGAIALIGWYLTTINSSIAAIQYAASSLTVRVTRVEQSSADGRDLSRQFQQDTKQTLGKLQDQQMAILSELGDVKAAVVQQNQNR